MLVCTIVVTYRIDRGRLGYQLRALKNSHEAAEVVGVDTYRAKLKANLLSAVITGAYGTFYAQFQFFIDADTVLGFWTISVKMAMMAILGGMGNVWGPLLGAAILVPLDEWTNAVFTGSLAAMSRLIYGGLLITLIIWQPRGLLHWVYKSVRRFRERPQATEVAGIGK
jgi:branched-chain amino acid transport system permease protein